MGGIKEGSSLCLCFVVASFFGFVLQFWIAHGTCGSMIPVPVVVPALPFETRALDMKDRMLVALGAVLFSTWIHRLAAHAEPRHQGSSHALC